MASRRLLSKAMTAVTQAIPTLPDSGPLPWRSSFSALTVRNFRIFCGANVLAMTATWMQRVAQDWLVLQLTGSAALVGITVFVQFAPMLFLGLFGGVIVDRYPKRLLLMGTQGTVGAVSLVLAILSLTGTVVVWQVWVAALVIGITTVVDNPARQVFANELVGPAHLRNAITLNSSTFQLGMLLGPAVSGLLIVAVGGGWSFAMNAAACAVTVFALTRLRVAEFYPHTPTPRRSGQLREGLRYVAAKPTILWPVVMVSFLSVFTLTMPVLLTAFASDVFHVGAAGYGLLNSLFAVGALSGAVLSTRRRTLRLRTVIICGGIWAVLQVAASFMPSEATFGAALIACGVANQFFFMAGNPLIQLSSNTAIRGRVMAVYVLVLLGGQALGGPLMGTLVDLAGAQTAMLLSGLVPALAAAGIGLLLAHRGALHLALSWRHATPHLSIQPR